MSDAAMLYRSKRYEAGDDAVTRTRIARPLPRLARTRRQKRSTGAFSSEPLRGSPSCSIPVLFRESKSTGPFGPVLLDGDPDENRTRVTAVKGRCLSRLTTGPDILVAGGGFEPSTPRV